MLLSADQILGYRIHAVDGNLGKVRDFLLDDRSWTIRYLVVDTGSWLPGRQVLISPAEVGEPSWTDRVVPVSLTRQEVEDSPVIEADLPISRQQEMRLVNYYGWLPYWGGMPPMSMPEMLPPVGTMQEPPDNQTHDPHLRSIREIIGYRIRAIDRQVGHLADFIVDSEDWTIRYLVADTRNWLPGKKVLLSPAWIDRIDWAKTLVYVDLFGEQVRNSPPFDPSEPVNREYEVTLYDYYGRPTYWHGQFAGAKK